MRPKARRIIGVIMSEGIANVDDCKIEVTFEMIEAGVDCLHDIDLCGFDEDDLNRVLANAFRRMLHLWLCGNVSGALPVRPASYKSARRGNVV